MIQENVMDNIITINNNIVEFTNKDEQVYVSSRDVAKVFEKLHKNVIKELEKILAEQSAKIGADIVKSSYLDDLGRNYKQYLPKAAIKPLVLTIGI